LGYLFASLLGLITVFFTKETLRKQ
jgi:hypothetical protein